MSTITTSSAPERGREWGKWGPMFVVLAVLLLLVGAYLLDLAAPQKATLLDKRWNAPVRGSWDLDVARTGLLLIVGSAASSGVGLLIRALLGRGGSDRAAQTLVALGIVSAIAATAIWTSVPLAR